MTDWYHEALLPSVVAKIREAEARMGVVFYGFLLADGLLLGSYVFDFVSTLVAVASGGNASPSGPFAGFGFLRSIVFAVGTALLLVTVFRLGLRLLLLAKRHWSAVLPPQPARTVRVRDSGTGSVYRIDARALVPTLVVLSSVSLAVVVALSSEYLPSMKCEAVEVFDTFFWMVGIWELGRAVAVFSTVDFSLFSEVGFLATYRKLSVLLYFVFFGLVAINLENVCKQVYAANVLGDDSDSWPGILSQARGLRVAAREIYAHERVNSRKIAFYVFATVALVVLFLYVDYRIAANLPAGWEEATYGTNLRYCDGSFFS
ncbi:hypothetical protein M0R88_09570 [Halorussus gelatinilyticus]|uniref:Uncharacterized protein n=1 Tax=Halorussus gelatinilyticus TaxID=2937524 RepID=A0A8U0IDI9_9EURY|nr:hypothetical protein [Halorussus gelatinilyticus]UPV98780.1 hypothetical protein M0R88_09570 [Halorussus gelatinilyticus]